MTDLEVEALQHGDPIVWLHRPRGGYCPPVRVLATYLGSTAKRVRIEVYREWPEPHPPWVIRKTVSLGYLRIPTPLETMRIESLATRACAARPCALVGIRACASDNEDSHES